jgi:glutamate--cysteine ligase catalytic subunit
MANHIAHLFIRDPLVVFSETLDQDDQTQFDHFENIQSTNWQTLRFKPPPPGTGMGWRVEFRSMEVQITDFENAAFSIFIVLLSRAILSFGINFYIPISKVDVNMKRAHKRNAAREEKFFFRKNIFNKRSAFNKACNGSGHGTPSRATSRSRHSSNNGAQPVPSPTESSTCASPHGPIEDEYGEFTLQELINGDGKEFPGLLGLVNAYLASLNVDLATKCELDRYLDLIKKRADGMSRPYFWRQGC